MVCKTIACKNISLSYFQTNTNDQDSSPFDLMSNSVNKDVFDP